MPSVGGAAGLKQRDLQNWYVQELHEKQPFSSLAEMSQELKRVKAIIQVLDINISGGWEGEQNMLSILGSIVNIIEATNMTI